MRFNLSYTLSKSQKQAFFIAVIVSILVQFLPLIKYVSQIYSTVSHELGHAITAWLFGYFALPKLDFLNGGGVTHILSRPFILIIIAIVFVFINLLVIKTQLNLKTNKIILIIFISYLIALISPIHLFIITLMGKVGELLFFYFFAWYALSRQKLNLYFKEQFYLTLAVFLWVNSVLDSFSLLYNKVDRLSYLAGKQQLIGGGGPLVNDLVKLGESSGLSFNFFNFFLLALAFLSMHKLLKIVDKSVLNKQRIRNYGVSLINISKSQFKNVKSLAKKEK
jgi:hypothetical protein